MNICAGRDRRRRHRGEHLPHAGVGVLPHHRAQLVDRRPHAGEVGHGRERGLALDPARDADGAQVTARVCHALLRIRPAYTDGLDGAIRLHADDGSFIEVAVPPVEEVFARARAGGITHSLVLDGLFFFEPIWRAKRAFT